MFFFFFFNDTATTEIYTLSLHDALPISVLDLRLIREDPEAVARGLADRGGAELVKSVLDLDASRRRLVKESEELKALKNRASETIGQAKRRGEDPAAEMARMREVGARIQALQGQLPR